MLGISTFTGADTGVTGGFTVDDAGGLDAPPHLSAVSPNSHPRVVCPTSPFA